MLFVLILWAGSLGDEFHKETESRNQKTCCKVDKNVLNMKPGNSNHKGTLLHRLQIYNVYITCRLQVIASLFRVGVYFTLWKRSLAVITNYFVARVIFMIIIFLASQPSKIE